MTSQQKLFFSLLTMNFLYVGPLGCNDASVVLILGYFHQLSTFTIFDYYLGEYYKRKESRKLTLNL